MIEDKKTLYSQIVEHLIKCIENKEILPGERLPTEQELMSSFNVSRITAKRALEELKNMGMIYRKKGHGSFLSTSAQKEETNKQKVISMIMPYEDSTGRFIDYIRGAGDYLYSKGYFLSVNCTDGYEAREREYLINMTKIGVSGVIYYPTNRVNNFDVLSMLYTKDYPIVLIDKYFNSLPLSYSVSDNFSGGYNACTHLIELGHRNIAFAASANIEAVSSVRDRFLGYCKALKDNDIDMNSEFICNSDEIRKKIENENITAVIAENDFVALDIMKALELEGINIPNDISLVGYDNIPILQQMNIPLTTIEQNFYDIGKKAAELVVDKIEGKGGEQVKAVTATKLIERSSTKIKSI